MARARLSLKDVPTESSMDFVCRLAVCTSGLSVYVCLCARVRTNVVFLESRDSSAKYQQVELVSNQYSRKD